MHYTDEVRSTLTKFRDAAEMDEDAPISREWFDTLTTLGLLARVDRRSWILTPAGTRELLDG